MIKAGRRIRYLWILSLIVFVLFSLFLIDNYLTEQNYIVSHRLAVINDTTNQIVWVGSGSLCIPSILNTRLAFDCGKSGDSGYDCEGVYYSLSKVQISCANSTRPGNV
jgi:hypothetical protein